MTVQGIPLQHVIVACSTERGLLIITIERGVVHVLWQTIALATNGRHIAWIIGVILNLGAQSSHVYPKRLDSALSGGIPCL